MRQNNRDQYYYRDQHHREIHDRDIERDIGMTHDRDSSASPQKSSTPRKQNRHTESTNTRNHDRYIHPLALKLKLQGICTVT